MNIAEVMKTRRSVRAFKPDPLPRECIEDLIAMAVTAPSASNKQPWRYYITDDRETIELMRSAVQKAIDRIVAHIEPEYRAAFVSYGDYFVRFSGAPAVIVPAYREIVVLSNLVNAAIRKEDFESIRMMEFNSGLASTALSIENLLLYAHSQGLGASCMTGPLVAEQKLKQILQIPKSWNIAAVVAVGYPEEEPQTTTRKSVESVVRWVPSNR